MRNLLAVVSLAAFAAAALTAPLWADMVASGDLHIEGPMLRATPPNAPVAGGFVTIHNVGETDDILISAAIAGDVAGMVQLHQMEMSEGVMKMSEVDGGIPLPAGEVVTLAPGGLHIMLMGLRAPLAAGDTHAVTLTFETAAPVTLDFPVLTLSEIRAAVEAGAMDHGKDHDHGGHADHGH